MKQKTAKKKRLAYNFYAASYVRMKHRRRRETFAKSSVFIRFCFLSFKKLLADIVNYYALLFPASMFLNDFFIDFFPFLVLGKRIGSHDVKFLGKKFSSNRLIGEKFLIDFNDITRFPNEPLNLSAFISERQASN